MSPTPALLLLCEHGLDAVINNMLEPLKTSPGTEAEKNVSSCFSTRGEFPILKTQTELWGKQRFTETFFTSFIFHKPFKVH